MTQAQEQGAGPLRTPKVGATKMGDSQLEEGVGECARVRDRRTDRDGERRISGKLPKYLKSLETNAASLPPLGIARALQHCPCCLRGGGLPAWSGCAQLPSGSPGLCSEASHMPG